MTRRGQRFGKVLFASMLLTLTVALSGCSGDKAAGDSTQIADTSAADSSEANTVANAETDTSTSEVTGEANETQDDASHITIGIPQDLDSLVPSLSQGAGTQEILYNIYEGLYKPDSEGNLVPAVASDYTMSEDGLVYTFTLRDGIQFHNGNPRSTF